MAEDEHSPLLSLPPELRLMICDCIYASLPQEYHQTKDFKSLEPTYLFQINRLIRAEAAPGYKQWLNKNAEGLLLQDMPPPFQDIDPNASAIVQLDQAKNLTVYTLRVLRMELRASKEELKLQKRCFSRG